MKWPRTARPASRHQSPRVTRRVERAEALTPRDDSQKERRRHCQADRVEGRPGQLAKGSFHDAEVAAPVNAIRQQPQASSRETRNRMGVTAAGLEALRHIEKKTPRRPAKGLAVSESRSREPSLVRQAGLNACAPRPPCYFPNGKREQQDQRDEQDVDDQRLDEHEAEQQASTDVGCRAGVARDGLDGPPPRPCPGRERRVRAAIPRPKPAVRIDLDRTIVAEFDAAGAPPCA